MFLLLLAVILYALVILYYTSQFFRKRIQRNISITPRDLPAVSVIIPLRNEIKHLPSLINCISQLNYPRNRVEMVWVNDHSTDGSWEFLQSHLAWQLSFPYRLINLSESEYGKRKALIAGIKSAQNNIIVTLDADCTVNPGWLETLTQQLIIQQANMIMGPVLLNYSRSIFSKFMAIEQLSLTATAAASAWAGNAILCSGANLIFYKSDFLDYAQKHLPSHPAGDDMFFLIYLKQQKSKKIGYAAYSQACVFTNAPENLSQFLDQRIRWVSKSRYYKDLYIIAVALIVALANFNLIALLVISCFNAHAVKYFIASLIIKMVADFLLLYRASTIFQQKKLLHIYPLAMLIYPIFATYASIYGNVGKYTWKNR